MDLGEAGERKIKGWEACARWINAIQRFVVYLDRAGKATIAWGHLLTAFELATNAFAKGLVQEECDQLFRVDIQRYVDAVRRAIKVAIGQHAFDALVCLCYNIGTAGLTSSTVARLINAGAPPDQIRAAWLMWDHCIDPKTGQKVEDAGLRNRRLDEFKLFVDPDAIHDTPTEEERERQKGLIVVPSDLEIRNQGAVLLDSLSKSIDTSPDPIAEETTRPDSPAALSPSRPPSA